MKEIVEILRKDSLTHHFSSLLYVETRKIRENLIIECTNSEVVLLRLVINEDKILRLKFAPTNTKLKDKKWLLEQLKDEKKENTG